MGHSSNVCALDSNYGLVVSGSWDQTARVWKDGKLLYTLEGHSQAVWAVKILSESLVLTGSADKTIRLWENGKAKKVFKGHTDAVRGLTIITSTSFASCSNDASIRIWDINSNIPLEELYGHTSFIYSIATIPATGEIVSSGEDRSFRVWRNGETVQVVTLPYVSAWSVAVNSENGDIAVGGSDGTIRIFTREPSRYAPDDEIKHFQDLVASSGIGKDQVGSVNKEKLEGKEGLLNPGKNEGEVKMIRTEINTVEAYQWSANEWIKIGEVVGSAGSTSKKLYNGVEYDYVFDVDIKDGEPALKLPYNVTENPYDAARRFLEQNELPMSYLDNVANFLIKNTEGVDLTNQAPAQDPYGTRYVPGIENSTSSNQHASQQSYSKSASKSSPTSTATNEKNLVVIPVKSFVQLSSFKAAPIIKAIKTNNSKQKVDKQLTEAEISFIEQNLAPNLLSEESSSSIFKIVTKGLQSWVPADILPLLDVLRIIIPSLRTFPPVVLLQSLLSSLDVDAPKHCLLALRGLVNLFSSPNTNATKLIESPSTRDNIFDIVKELGALPDPKPEPRNLAISSLIYNYAVLSWKHGGSVMSSNALLKVCVELFPVLIDSESRYRLLLATGTLLVDCGSAGKSMVAEALERFKDLPVDEERLTVVLSDIKQLI